MTVQLLAYEDFLRKTANSTDPFVPFVQEEKTVYVYALTRDLCSGCEIQKPLYEKLAQTLTEKYGNRVRFARIHVPQTENFRDELKDFRRFLKFAAYPTYVILLKTELGILETYRGIEPPMDEVARHVELAIELANR